MELGRTEQDVVIALKQIGRSATEKSIRSQMGRQSGVRSKLNNLMEKGYTRKVGKKGNAIVWDLTSKGRSYKPKKIITTKKPSTRMTKEERAKKTREAYDIVWSSQFIDTKDVASSMNISTRQAYGLLKNLENKGLVYGQEQEMYGGIVGAGSGGRGANKTLSLLWEPAGGVDEDEEFYERQYKERMGK